MKTNKIALTPLALGVMFAIQVEAAPMILVGAGTKIDDAGAAGAVDAVAATGDKVSISAAAVELVGNSTVTGTLTTSDKLEVTAGGLNVVAGGATISGNSTVTGTLGVTQQTTTAGIKDSVLIDAKDITAGGTLGVIGATTTAGITDSVLIDAKDITAGGTLGVIGATTTAGITDSGTIAATNVTVSGSTTTKGIDNGNGGILQAGAITGATNITASGDVTANKLTDGVVSITGGNITGVKSITVGDLTVNGTFTRSTASADAISNTSNVGISNVVGSATANNLAAGGVVNYTNLISGSAMSLDNTSATMTAVAGSSKASVALASDSAMLGVTNTTTAKFHGVEVGLNSTKISGGTQTTSLNLDDTGAHFSSTLGAGGNAQVTGVADGINKNDAVNRSQLNTAYAGVASVAALAALPQPAPGRHFSVGVGSSYYQGESGLAVGMKGSLTDTTQFSLGGSWNSSGEGLVNGGVGMSW